MKKKAFTLIELIAVLVILAILALIVTPLVMNIVRKARNSADKRSIDAYGRSVELAIATYLLDNGDFPTDISQLSVEYTGGEVVCQTTQLNNDSSVYLAECTVAGRSVDGYTYGSDKSPSYTSYFIGDEVTYNNVDYYVIRDSGAKEQTVTLLKAEPLTADEVKMYGGVGTENNHVNMYNYKEIYSSGCSECTDYYRDTIDGAMAYYTSKTCTYSYSGDETGCRNDYESSEIKYVVDAWANDKLNNQDLEIDKTGYSYRLITLDETTLLAAPAEYEWFSKYCYWTMTPDNDTSNEVYVVDQWSVFSNKVNFGNENSGGYCYFKVRPVITLKKSALEN